MCCTCRPGTDRSVSAALAWLRTTARSFRGPPRASAAASATASAAAPTPQQSAYFSSLMLRANLIMCKLPIQTDGVSFTAAISDDAESDDDDNEPVINPLRTADAQVRVTRARSNAELVTGRAAARRHGGKASVLYWGCDCECHEGCWA